MKRKSRDSKSNPSQKVFQSTLFGDEEEILGGTVAEVRLREARLRSAANIYTESVPLTNFPSLLLPFRWEALQEVAQRRKIPLKPLIMPVEESIACIRRELRQIQETAMGRLLVLSGSTGSGKTTFLNSLRYFLEDVAVHDVKYMDLTNRQAIEFSLSSLQREKDKHSVVVLEGKETPGSLKSEEIDILLTTLNADFRKSSGRTTLFVIPTTSQSVAKSISDRAASVGGMVSSARPFHVFEGPPRHQFYSITNDTVRALNESRTLREYGVSEEISKDLAQTSGTIGEFMANCYNEFEQRRDGLINAAGIHASGVIDRKRKRLHLWMVFSSTEKNTRRNNDLIRSLTFGDQQHVQVQRILAGDAQEARYWQERKSAFALAAQYLDLRIMYLPVRTANAVLTAYGPKEFLQHLKSLNDEGNIVMKRQAVRSSAQDSLRNTAIGAFLRDEGFVERDPTKRVVTDKHLAIFAEIVKQASKDDKSMNAALADAIREWYPNGEAEVFTELSLNDTGSLTCDIGVVTATDVYCLELKWRSSELFDSEVIRETAGRVSEFARELPELRNQLGD